MTRVDIVGGSYISLSPVRHLIFDLARRGSRSHVHWQGPHLNLHSSLCEPRFICWEDFLYMFQYCHSMLPILQRWCVSSTVKYDSVKYMHLFAPSRMPEQPSAPSRVARCSTFGLFISPRPWGLGEMLNRVDSLVGESYFGSSSSMGLSGNRSTIPSLTGRGLEPAFAGQTNSHASLCECKIQLVGGLCWMFHD